MTQSRGTLQVKNVLYNTNKLSISSDIAQFGELKDFILQIAGNNPSCITLFLPTKFACWHRLYSLRPTIRMTEA